MPIAGPPPYATDEPDSAYESVPAPQRRIRQPPPPDPNSRTSAYDVYNNYIADDTNRQSGVGALGMGFLNGSLDDDSDDDDDDAPRKPVSAPAPQPATPATPTSKHAALAAATGVKSHSTTNTTPSSPPRQIAAPQPGYAAPIEALNLARPEPIATAQGRQPQPRLQIENPFEPTSSHGQPHPQSRDPFQPPPRSPISPSPHPLQPPVTPITPVFARPAKSAPGIKFSEAVPRDPTKPIMRGNSEETLLPKRGEKGDDFWRRFSMIAKEPMAQKESPWLRKTRDGSSRLSRWVWVVAVLLLITIGGAIGLGWYFSHNTPDHQQPTALGGSANEVATSSSSAAPVVTVNGQTKTSLHVTPTHTVARRILAAQTTPVVVAPGQVRGLYFHKKRRLQLDALQ